MIHDCMRVREEGGGGVGEGLRGGGGEGSPPK